MITHPVKGLWDRDPKPSDYGHEVTVCIAALCEGGKRIVAVSDHMVTFGSFSTDGTTLKSEPLHPNWYAFFAGDEIGHVRPILSHAKFMIWDMARGTRSKDLSDNEIAYLMSIAIQNRLQTMRF